MKKIQLTVFFAVGIFSVGCLLPNIVLANDGNSLENSVKNTQEIKEAKENKETKGNKEIKKKKGLLEQIFPSVGARLWNPSISGHVRVNGSGHGDQINLKDTLGLKMKDTQATGADGIGEEVPESKFRFNFEYYKLVGDKSLGSNTSFQDKTYAAGERVESELRIKYLTAKWLPTYSPVGDQNSSLVLELVYFGNKQRMNEHAENGMKDFNGFIPAIGYRVETGRTSNTIYYGEASIYPMAQYYYNAEAGIVKKFGKLALGAGYRVCAQKMKSGNDELEFKASGPFFQAIYKF